MESVFLVSLEFGKVDASTTVTVLAFGSPNSFVSFSQVGSD